VINAGTLPGWTKLFLATTAATSVTDFFFPFHGFTPTLALGLMSLVVLPLASLRYIATGFSEPGGGPTRLPP
jgi:hypothetical protein